jgi:hypothetical protein
MDRVLGSEGELIPAEAEFSPIQALPANRRRKSMQRFFAVSFLLLLIGCGDKAKDLFDTAQLEEKQNNRPHAIKLYRQIVEDHSASPYANQAKARLSELEKAR